MTRRDFLVRTSLLATAGLMARPLFGDASLTPAERLAAGLSPEGDLRLPAWGPYTKEFAGISHIPAIERGIRFDLSVFPALNRRRQIVPSVNSDTGFYAWSADADLRTYTLRHVLDGLESLYVDLTYAEHADGRVIRARFVNRTPLPQQTALHYLASLHFPEIGPYRQPAIQPAEVILPRGAVWIDGSHYSELSLDDDQPQRHLPDNAEIWGEVRGDGFVHGIALGKGFGSKPGHRVGYALPAEFSTTGTVALLRYRLARGAHSTVNATGAYAGTLTLEGTGEFQLAELAPVSGAALSFQLEPAAGAELELDGIALVPRDQRERVGFHVPPLERRPVIERDGEKPALTMQYSAVAGCYGLAWEDGDHEVREWLSDNLERDFALFTHEHVKKKFDQGGKQHYTNVFVRPVLLAPGETKDLFAFVCHNPDATKVHARLSEFMARPEAFKAALTALVQETPALPAHTEPGRAYAYGVERLAATVATNIVYPVRRRGRFFRHYTPGRWWDSLYTWDSGFIGLGLLELAPARSVDNLAAYLTDASDDCAFVHHGSPVPVQIYQLQGLWNRTQDRDVLRKLFPGARRMHRFLAGRGDGSRTRTLQSGLLRTWDYFYNSGGWDDYPPQKFIRGTALTRTTAPVVNTAHAIRTARQLRVMAALLGEPTDEFEADIAAFTAALQQHAWNPASGWFSYVRHDEAGRPVGPLLHESGADFNRGFDGIYPLMADACTPEQETLFLRRLRDEKVFWSRCGLSTVDQSAPYFRDDGYWNGTVWMPHQWFIWKTLLDLGQGELAWQVAHTALRTWENEVRATGSCFEHFIIKTGRGAGWHQFGGLSSPVLGWFATYFRPGTLTGGLDCWVLEQTADDTSLRARLRLGGKSERKPVVVAVVPRANPGSVRWRGAPVPVVVRQPGTLEITLPSGAAEGELIIG
ncbi:MAG: hypothetical protein HYV95_01285 [Opitutae bacterium]|nr:hypothetical protein [Opitutae bacterium]